MEDIGEGAEPSSALDPAVAAIAPTIREGPPAPNIASGLAGAADAASLSLMLTPAPATSA
jgi:hypothetical protein